MAIHTDGLRERLQAFAFEDLFREELGWDTHKQTLSVAVGETAYALGGRAQKRGFVVLECAPGPGGAVPENATRVRIQHQVAKLAHEHIIIYTDTAKTHQVWQWVKRQPGRPAVRRELRYHRGQSGEQLVQRLRAIAFGLEEEDRLNIVEGGGGCGRRSTWSASRSGSTIGSRPSTTRFAASSRACRSRATRTGTRR